MSESFPVQSWLSHLLELRSRLMWVVGAFIVVFAGLFSFSQELYTLIAQPMLSQLPKGSSMIATGTVSPFMVQLQTVAYASVLIIVPLVLYHAWAFVAPGLYQHEKKLVLPLLVSSVICFILGVAFCYFLVLPVLVKFMVGTTALNIKYMPDVVDYLSTVWGLFLVFGFAFELPVLVVLLAQTRLVSLAQLQAARRYVILAVFVVAAIVTPPDVLSQLLLAVPLCLLYELALLWVRLTHK